LCFNLPARVGQLFGPGLSRRVIHRGRQPLPSIEEPGLRTALSLDAVS
jgi:hypothetical protein